MRPDINRSAIYVWSGRRRYKGEKAGTKACLHRRRSGTSWLGPAKPLSWRKSAKTGARRTGASLTGGSAGSAAPAPRSPTAGGYHRAAPQEPPSAAGRRAAPARAWEPGGRPRLGRCPWTRGPAHRPWAASVPAAVDERQVADELLEGARAAPLALLLDRGFRGHHWKLDISPAYAKFGRGRDSRGVHARSAGKAQPVPARFRNRIETTTAELTEQPGLARHGSNWT
jgi:hypothetical protein